MYDFSMAVSIKIDNLVKYFGAVHAIDHISLDIEPGEIFFLLGPSGCGKTTLLRTIAGFHDVDSGRIFIGERDVTRMPAHRRETGMVFQSYALWPHMTVEENVAFGLEIRGVPKSEAARRVAAALESVHMSDRAKYRPNKLSGGQQQRVALARALVIEPKCILLDEPLSNLDAKLRVEMRTEIRRICKTHGLTAIYVTHDQKEALSIADRLAVLNAGRVEQIGSPAEVYRRPDNPFVAGFIGEANFIGGKVVARMGNGVAVDTAIGMVVADMANVMRKGIPEIGGDVTLCARPEAVKVSRVGKNGGENTFAATLSRFSYQGDLLHFQLELGVASGNAIPINAVELGGTAVPDVPLEEGAAVSVCLPRDQVLVL